MEDKTLQEATAAVSKRVAAAFDLWKENNKEAFRVDTLTDPKYLFNRLYLAFVHGSDVTESLIWNTYVLPLGGRIDFLQAEIERLKKAVDRKHKVAVDEMVKREAVEAEIQRLGRTVMEKTENEIIAEFMGWTFDADGYCYHEDITDRGEPIQFQNEYIKQYHISWDWLMPVVEKIESLGFEFTICQDKALVMNDLKGLPGPLREDNLPYNKRFEYESSGTKGSKIECVYQTALAFIHWYTSLTK